LSFFVLVVLDQKRRADIQNAHHGPHMHNNRSSTNPCSTPPHCYTKAPAAAKAEEECSSEMLQHHQSTVRCLEDQEARWWNGVCKPHLALVDAKANTGVD
jgi:hypothetical protein